MKDKTLSPPGTMELTRKNMDEFCANMLYASACNYTWLAYVAIAKAEPTPNSSADMKFYLETLFMRPLEENI
jgi:hypothetical protein